MRLGAVTEDGGRIEVVVDDGRYLPLAPAPAPLDSVVSIAGAGPAGLRRLAGWTAAQPAAAWRPLAAAAAVGPPIRPPAIYAIGQNYRPAGVAAAERPARPLVYGKTVGSISGQEARVTWDRRLTANVDAECELGVVIGATARRVAPPDAARHVFGYTVVDDVSSRDPWLDGDQWLLGKSMDGFCPVGPWVVTADAFTPDARRLGCRLNGEPIQDGITTDMWFDVAEIVAYLSRHVTLEPGTLIATGTPARLAGPPGPERHLRRGDVVAAWIEGLGELITRIG